MNSSQACGEFRHSSQLPLTARATFALTAAMVLMFLCPADGAAGADAERRPNIVYILADDLGYGDVHCLNPQRGKILTPHLDRLASQGRTFTDAHSGSSVCTPTRYGLLTGRYAWRTHLQRGVYGGTNDPPLIATGRLTAPALLKQHGYATAAIGKWHLGFATELPAANAAGQPKARSQKRQPVTTGLPVGTRIIDGPVARGFDYFWGCSNARTMSVLLENDRVIECIEPITMLPRLGERAVKYVQEQAAAARAGQPFFLYLPLTSPHTPILPTSEWQGQSGLGAYGDFVMQTDAVVGDLLAALDTQGLADNTLVVFTSDNGCSPAAGTERLEQQSHFASGDFRGYKADIWDGGHRVPFFVRWPGRVPPGSQSSQLICHTDLLATCAEIVGATLPETAGEDSVSILPALLGRDASPLRQAVVHHSIHGRFAIRADGWKLNLCPGSGGWAQPGDAEAARQGLPAVQLYDLSNDVGETKNLQAEHPEIVARLTGLLEQYVTRGRSTPGADQANDRTVDIFQARGATRGE